MPDVPKILIVVGGGVIGVEYTCMFAALGVRVILVEKRPRLLEFADLEIIEAPRYHLRDHRVTMRLNEEVESVEDTPTAVVANLMSKKKISGDTLLYAVGRQGNVEELDLPAAGLEADSRGRIPVNGGYQNQGAAIFTRWASHRISLAGVRFDGTGTHRRGARLGTTGTLNPATILTGFTRFRR